MSLVKGDHLVIKRNGLILTPDVGEVYHEFKVMNEPIGTTYHLDGSPLEVDYEWKESDQFTHGYNVQLKVVH
ncbi:hypothetical protein LCGC14_1403730 [marine sediment metagenome]|uniref:Uncharacterized protein n=1 Tax=marine sediment metagenome TaxID=412755 RepID=A0A0F9MXW3_9ZZZZ